MCIYKYKGALWCSAIEAATHFSAFKCARVYVYVYK